MRNIARAKNPGPRCCINTLTPYPDRDFALDYKEGLVLVVMHMQRHTDTRREDLLEEAVGSLSLIASGSDRCYHTQKPGCLGLFSPLSGYLSCRCHVFPSFSS